MNINNNNKRGRAPFSTIKRLPSSPRVSTVSRVGRARCRHAHARTCTCTTPILGRVCAKFAPFSQLVDAIFIDFGCERLPAASSQTIKTIKNQYHTNTTSFTRIPKRIKKVVNTTPIPVNYNHCTEHAKKKRKNRGGRRKVPGCC